MSMRYQPSFIFVILIFNVMQSPLSAQVSSGVLSQEILRPSSASFYFIAKPGELSMQVNIWGYVQNPGRYEVPTATDLVKLVSYAGGPKQDAVLDNVKVTRNISRAGAQPEEYFVNLEELADVDPKDLVLYPDDTIFIDHSSWVNIRDAFALLTTAAIVTTAVAQIINVTNN